MLKRRAPAFLDEAKRVSDQDLSVFFAEKSMQLYLRAVVERESKPGMAARIFEAAVEGHGLPWDAPVELHIAAPTEAERYLADGEAIAIPACTKHRGAAPKRSHN